MGVATCSFGTTVRASKLTIRATVREAGAELYGLSAEISLVAPRDVGSAAEALHNAAIQLPLVASGLKLATGGTVTYRDADQIYLAAWNAFRAAAGKDLA